MRNSNRGPEISRSSRRRQGQPGQESSVQRRASWTVGKSALGVLTMLGGFGFMTYAGAEPAAASRFSPEEQQIVEKLPFGFTEASCETASNPPPSSVASLDCGQNAGLNTPLGGHFALFADPDSLNRAFQNGLTNRGSDYVPSPCPGLEASPTAWHYTATPWETAGQIVCGTFKGVPDIEWTRDRELLLLDVHDGPDVNSLYQWWDRYGNEPREPIPFTR